MSVGEQRDHRGRASGVRRLPQEGLVHSHECVVQGAAHLAQAEREVVVAAVVGGGHDTAAAAAAAREGYAAAAFGRRLAALQLR